MATSAASAATPVRGWASAAAAARLTGAESERVPSAMSRARAQAQRMPVGLRPVTQQQLEARHLRRAASAPANGDGKTQSADAVAVLELARMSELVQSDDDDGDDGEWKSVESKSRWNRSHKRMIPAAPTPHRAASSIALAPRVQASSYYSWATTSVTSASSAAVAANSKVSKMPPGLRDDSSRRPYIRQEVSSTSASGRDETSSTTSSSLHKSSSTQQDETRRNTSARGRKPEQNGYHVKTNRSGVRSPPPASDPDLSRSTSLQQLLDRIELEKQADEQAQQQSSNRRRNDQGSSSSSDQDRRSSIEPVKPSASPPQKCGDKRDFFFRNLEFETRNRLQIDDVAGFSVTEHEMATKISEAILALYAGDEHGDSAQDQDQEHREKSSLTITDATACIGGNVISFCDYFAIVNAVECDLVRCEMLQHNLGVLEKGNAICIHASYLMVMQDLQQDVVFIDPPWGGPEYKDLAKVDLFLDGIPLYDICRMLHGRADIVVLKVPTNFDAEKFAEHVPGEVTVRKDFNKMHLVAIDFREERREQKTSNGVAWSFQVGEQAVPGQRRLVAPE